MSERQDLHTILKEIMGDNPVYFQPPSTVKMAYPCIVYKRSMIKTKFADNSPYMQKKRYTITVIDKDPDSSLPDQIGALQLCSFDRHFTFDNLNHDVYNIYF
jgi:hypothetical protein